MKWIFPFVVLLVCVQSLYGARCALLVGNAHGGSEVTALRYVDNDLTSIEGALTRYCGFEPDNIITLSGKGPAELHEALATLGRSLPQGMIICSCYIIPGMPIRSSSKWEMTGLL